MVLQSDDCGKIVILLAFHFLGFFVEIVLAWILSPVLPPIFMLLSFICRLPLSYFVCIIRVRTSKKPSDSYFDRQTYEHAFGCYNNQNLSLICPLALSCMVSAPISLSLWLGFSLIGIGALYKVNDLGDLKNWTPDSGDLATKARCLVSIQGYRWSDIYISPSLISKSNAVGCCRQGINQTYILLDESLLKQNTDRIISVLAQEIGHWRGNHSLKGLGVICVSMGVNVDLEIR